MTDIKQPNIIKKLLNDIHFKDASLTMDGDTYVIKVPRNDANKDKSYNLYMELKHSVTARVNDMKHIRSKIDAISLKMVEDDVDEETLTSLYKERKTLLAVCDNHKEEINKIKNGTTKLTSELKTRVDTYRITKTTSEISSTITSNSLDYYEEQCNKRQAFFRPLNDKCTTKLSLDKWHFIPKANDSIELPCYLGMSFKISVYRGSVSVGYMVSRRKYSSTISQIRSDSSTTTYTFIPSEGTNDNSKSDQWNHIIYSINNPRQDQASIRFETSHGNNKHKPIIYPIQNKYGYSGNYKSHQIIPIINIAVDSEIILEMLSYSHSTNNRIL